MDGTQTITIEVDSEVADFYNSATTENRRKLSAILNLKLREAARPKRSAIDIMDEISHQAESNGLTPEILATLTSFSPYELENEAISNVESTESTEGILKRKHGILMVGGQLEEGFESISIYS
jgi:hypothetical protein